MGHKNNSFNGIRSIRIDNNRSIDFRTPKIMGILNLTPDSFYDGGLYSSNDELLKRTELMLDEGADIIDIGAVSTRPGAQQVDTEEEIERLLVPLSKLLSEFPDAIFSVDTYRSKVAEESILAGAHIINDISGGTMDENMFNIIGRYKVPYIMMHIHGTPQKMQDSPITSEVVEIVLKFFTDQLAKLDSFGVSEIVLDPGFGFGKSLESNYQLLKDLENTRVNNLPILAGVSRKSMINKVLNTAPGEALNGTTSLNTIALISGANILRVHDVKEAKECVKLANKFLNPSE